jgi:predicted GNAT family N-acyltransferase
LAGHKIKLPLGIRFIEKNDISKHIKSFVPEMDKFSLADYYKWSLEENSHVLVREVDENITAVLYLTIHDDHIMIEMVVRNKESVYSKGSGGDLIKAIETIIAKYYNKTEIRLEAMEQVVSYYEKFLKYVKYGKPYADPGWGSLVPMKKLLT